MDTAAPTTAQAAESEMIRGSYLASSVSGESEERAGRGVGWGVHKSISMGLSPRVIANEFSVSGELKPAAAAPSDDSHSQEITHALSSGGPVLCFAGPRAARGPREGGDGPVLCFAV